MSNVFDTVLIEMDVFIMICVYYHHIMSMHDKVVPSGLWILEKGFRAYFLSLILLTSHLVFIFILSLQIKQNVSYVKPKSKRSCT